VDLTLQPTADADQAGSHAHQTTCLADLERRDPTLGQQVGAQQVGQGLGIHRVVLDPRRGDGAGGQRMGHVGGDPGIGQQVGEPAPADGGLEGDLDRLRRQLTEDAQELVGLARDRAVEDRLPRRVDGSELRALAVQVDADVHHDWASFASLVLRRTLWSTS